MTGKQIKTFPNLIAEVAQAHDGSLKKAHAYIDAVAATGVQTIKFQTHIAAAESSEFEPFRVAMPGNDKSRFDYWKRMEFTLEEWKSLKKHCDDVDLEFLSSPFSNAAVDLLEKVGVHRYKIGSGEVTNFLLLQRIVETKKPILLSSGMSSYEELDKTVAFLKSKEADFSLMQCTTEYPTKPENYGLRAIRTMRERYRVPVGYSDHSAEVATGIAALAMGAEFLEFHVKLDASETGPDASSSLTIKQVGELVAAVKKIHTALKQSGNEKDTSKMQQLKQMFEKSLAVNKSLSAGHVLQFADLEAKKPKGYGIDATDFEQVLGKKLRHPKKQWDFLEARDLQET